MNEGHESWKSTHVCMHAHTQMQVMIAERELCWGRKVPKKSGEGRVAMTEISIVCFLSHMKPRLKYSHIDWEWAQILQRKGGMEYEGGQRWVLGLSMCKGQWCMRLSMSGNSLSCNPTRRNQEVGDQEENDAPASRVLCSSAAPFLTLSLLSPHLRSKKPTS